MSGADPKAHFLGDQPIRWLASAEKAAKRAFYAIILPDMRAAARRVGWALAVHGSEERDLDLVAVPWVKGAVPAEELVRVVEIAAVGAGRLGRREVVSKPYGRRGYVIHVGRTAYVDLSVVGQR